MDATGVDIIIDRIFLKIKGYGWNDFEWQDLIEHNRDLFQDSSSRTKLIGRLRDYAQQLEKATSETEVLEKIAKVLESMRLFSWARELRESAAPAPRDYSTIVQPIISAVQNRGTEANLAYVVRRLQVFGLVDSESTPVILATIQDCCRDWSTSEKKRLYSDFRGWELYNLAAKIEEAFRSDYQTTLALANLPSRNASTLTELAPLAEHLTRGPWKEDGNSSKWDNEYVASFGNHLQAISDLSPRSTLRPMVVKLLAEHCKTHPWETPNILWILSSQKASHLRSLRGEVSAALESGPASINNIDPEVARVRGYYIKKHIITPNV